MNTTQSRSFAAFGVAVALMFGAFAGPARADLGDPHCNYIEGYFNVCISTELAGDWHLSIGIDVNSSRSYADTIMNCSNNNPFRAELWGDDGDDDEDDYRTELYLADGWPVVSDGGISARFQRSVDWRVLNEDDGTDEIYARIYLRDCNGNERRFDSGKLVHNF